MSYYKTIGVTPFDVLAETKAKAQNPSLLDRLKAAGGQIKDAYVDQEKTKVKSQIAKGVGIGALILGFAFIVSRR